jgi:phosphatidylglycerophosphatase A
MPIGVLQLVAFGLFRGFDILKPPPIRWVDRRWKGGWGVMADDLVAAAFTLMAVAVLLRIWWWLA